MKKVKQKLALLLVLFTVLTTVNVTPAHAAAIGGGMNVTVWDWVAGSGPSISQIAKKIPNRLLRDGDSVEVGEFDRKVRGQNAWKEDGGWVIERDKAGNNSHGGSHWKLKNKNGQRIATLDEDGNILRD